MMDLEDEQLNVKLNTNVKRRSPMILAVCSAVVGWQAHTPRDYLGVCVEGATKSKSMAGCLQLIVLRNCS